MRLADRVAEEMRLQHVRVVMRGDGLLVDACSDFVKRNPHHPMTVTDAALDSCGKALDLFEPHLVHAHDLIGRSRLVRAFRLKDSK
jgi:hypothetical protein